jgi:hypothetical protein
MSFLGQKGLKRRRRIEIRLPEIARKTISAIEDTADADAFSKIGIVLEEGLDLFGVGELVREQHLGEMFRPHGVLIGKHVVVEQGSRPDLVRLRGGAFLQQAREVAPFQSARGLGACGRLGASQGEQRRRDVELGSDGVAGDAARIGG